MIMKKEIIISASLLLLSATPVFAHFDNDKTNGSDNHAHFNWQNKTENPTITPINCDPSEKWKNHGEYVSCIAHKHHIKNKCNKNNRDIDPTPTPTISETPTPSPTITPTDTITPFISDAPEPSDSPTPVSSSASSPDVSNMDVYHPQAKHKESLIENIIAFFAHLL